METAEQEKNTHTPMTRPQIDRLREIHTLISEGKYPSTSALAEKLECSTSTISRDIENLRSTYFAPIGYSAEKRGYYYSEKYTCPLFTPISLKELAHAPDCRSARAGL